MKISLNRIFVRSQLYFSKYSSGQLSLQIALFYHRISANRDVSLINMFIKMYLIIN